MPRTPRQALAALLIALHATIAACGPGLHAAPGLGHAGPPGVPSGSDRTLALTTASVNLAEHCPLCDYFAQGQLSIPAASWTSWALVLPAEPVGHLRLAPRPPQLTSRSRAPPLGDPRTV